MPEIPTKRSPVILVIEDDEEIGYLLKFLLTRERFEVKHAVDGREAFDLINSMTIPRLVLCDINLPYIDGFQLLSMMRGKPDWKEIPIVMLTSKSQESDVVRALGAGANDYITKPFSPKELVARLRRFLK